MKSMKLKDQSKMLLSHILSKHKDVKEFYDINQDLVLALMIMQGGGGKYLNELKTLVNDFIRLERGVAL
jgi:acyl-CoA synthetase (NDP forming)